MNIMAKPKSNTEPRNPDGNRADKEEIALGNALGQRLRVICDAREIAHVELAVQIGIDKSAVSSLIAGRRGSKVTAVTVARIADALDVDFEWLYLGRGSGHAFARKGFI